MSEESYSAMPESKRPTTTKRLTRGTMPMAVGVAIGEITLIFTIPKFAIQTLQKADQLGWKPVIVLNSIDASVQAVLKPAGLDKAVGSYSAVYVMDPSNPAFKPTEGIGRAHV